MQQSHIKRAVPLPRWATAAFAGVLTLVVHTNVHGHGETGDVARYGVFVYSDLCVNHANGEGGGQRITLLRTLQSDHVIYEFTAGSLIWPVIASDVNIAPDMGALYFTVQSMDGEYRTIGGELSGDRASIALGGGYCDGNTVPMVLPRVTDFNRTLQACTPCQPVS
jgi:hypothetical protein